MKIEPKFNAHLVNFKNESTKSADPFELNLEIIELSRNEMMAPQTSYSICTPCCGMTGTGNSFCC